MRICFFKNFLTNININRRYLFNLIPFVETPINCFLYLNTTSHIRSNSIIRSIMFIGRNVLHHYSHLQIESNQQLIIVSIMISQQEISINVHIKGKKFLPMHCFYVLWKLIKPCIVFFLFVIYLIIYLYCHITLFSHQNIAELISNDPLQHIVN